MTLKYINDWFEEYNKTWLTKEYILNEIKELKEGIKLMSETKPNCYECKHRGDIPGDCHSSCSNRNATVTGDEHGIKNGWFYWPFNFDPTWLISCNGFVQK